MWMREKMVHGLPEHIPLHAQELNYGVGICELEDHVEEKGLSSNWLTKFQPVKKIPLVGFHSCLLKCT
jgi:hypothetical protein